MTIRRSRPTRCPSNPDARHPDHRGGERTPTDLTGPDRVRVALVGVWLLPGIDGWNGSERPEAIRITTLCAILAVVCLPVAARLLRGRRQLVLFLRRFGFDDATRTLTHASSVAVGRAWRLVTLDHDRVAPRGGPPRQRRRLGTASAIAAVVVVAVVVFVVAGGPDLTFDAAFVRRFTKALEGKLENLPRR